MNNSTIASAPSFDDLYVECDCLPSPHVADPNCTKCEGSGMLERPTWRCHSCNSDCTDVQAEQHKGCPSCGSTELINHTELLDEQD